MNQHTFRGIAAVFALLAFSGAVQAEVVQCENAAGGITFSDVPCQTSEKTVRASDADQSLPADTKASPAISSFVAAERARAAAWAVKRPPRGRLADDVATIKAARSSLILLEHASDLARQQALNKLKT